MHMLLHLVISMKTAVAGDGTIQKVGDDETACVGATSS